MKGLGVSKGIGIGKIFKVDIKETIVKKINIEDVSAEIAKLKKAIEKCVEDTRELYEFTIENIGKKEAEIFMAHEVILQDEVVLEEIEELIVSQNVNCEYAVKHIFSVYIDMLEKVEDDYLMYRSCDLKDIMERLIRLLSGDLGTNVIKANESTVIVARDLTPSETAQMDINNIAALITEKGGATSHVAIIAKTIGIPTIVGAEGIFDAVNNGEEVICDGASGEIFLNPTKDMKQEFLEKIKENEKNLKRYKKQIGLKTVTKDGYEPKLEANIGLPSDVTFAIGNDAEGIGLTRTEFIYMSKDKLPTEEEQFVEYKKIIESMNGKHVIIRTLDVGGDKKIDYLDIPKEENPFLGYRAIRLCLNETEIFKSQLRAILRASAYGNIKIMFPMISSIEELRAAKLIYNEAKNELENENIKIGKNIEIGIMIEIPSAAVIADVLAKEVDFFSIGTNDLIQYTLAADRMNSKISYVYNQYHPAILRIIRDVINKGHEAGIKVGMCGDMAGSIDMIPLLIGMGLDEFSMSPSSILPARELVRNISKKECEKILSEVMRLETSEEIENYLKIES